MNNPKTSGLRVAEGTKRCGLCNTNKDIIQFERNIKRKGLPIIEIAFLCKGCAEKYDLIRDSIEGKADFDASEVDLCPHCNCMTHTIGRAECGKCHQDKRILIMKKGGKGVI